MNRMLLDSWEKGGVSYRVFMQQRPGSDEICMWPEALYTDPVTSTVQWVVIDTRPNWTPAKGREGYVMGAREVKFWPPFGPRRVTAMAAVVKQWRRGRYGR